MGIALAGLVALAIAMGIGRFAFTPLLPMMQEDAGLSLAQGAWLASANYAGYLAGALAVSFVRIGGTAAIRSGLLAIALSTLAMGLIHSFPAWLVLRAVAGIASAFVLVHVSAWTLRQLAPLGRPLLNGVVYTGIGGGIIAAGLLCLALMRLEASSSLAWILLGLASLAAALAIRSRIDSGPAQHEARADKAAGWGEGAWRLVVCYGLYGFGYIIPATFIPSMAKEIVRDPLVFGWAWPAFGAAAAASCLAAGFLQRWHSARAVWAGCQVLLAFGVAAPAAWPGMPGILLGSLCVGGTFVVITMVGMQEARAVAATHAARLMGAMTAAFAAGQIVGPVVVTLWLSRGGKLDDSLFAASFLLLASTLLLVQRKALPR
jgi:MFS family permease